MISSPTRRREAYVVFSLAALYLLFWLTIPKPSFWGLDNGFKFQGMKAFAETGSIVLPNRGIEFGIDSKFRPLQPPFGLATATGQIPVFSPLFMVLGGLLIKVFGDWGPYLLPLIGGWGVLFGSWQLWRNQRQNHDARVFLGLIGVGSPILFYTMALWEHTLATALFVFAIVLLFPPHSVKVKSSDAKGIFPAGLLIAIASGLRSEVILWAVILVVFWKDTGRQLPSMLRFIFGITAGLLAIALINFWQTTVPYPMHILANLIARPPSSIVELVITRLQNIYILLLQGFPSNVLSLLCFIPIALAVLRPLWRDENKLGPYISASVAMVGMIYLFSIFKSKNMIAYTAESGGMIWISPIIALAFMPLSGERRKFWQLMWKGSLLTIVLLAAISPAVKGVHWGPRHLLMIYPIVLLLASVRLQRWWQRRAEMRAIIIILASLSVMNQFVSFFLEFRHTIINKFLNEWTAKCEDDFVITRNWWLPGDCAIASYNQPWFVLRKGESMSGLIKELRAKDARKIHYFESPRYSSDASFEEFGIRATKVDIFLKGHVIYKHSLLELIPPGEVPQEASKPVDIPDPG